MNYADYWMKHHPELHHKNIQKEFLTPTIVLEMLRLEQQQLQKRARHEITMISKLTILLFTIRLQVSLMDTWRGGDDLSLLRPDP